mmetsp:Transcript_32374/g.59723  ORF Transcript_32374/g.59723 Transcript_32374/m.59723 type:complete len:115 (+) Transcript_32374:429-773(+)
MAVDEFDVLSPFGYGTFQIIAEGVGARGDLLKDSSDNGLLAIFPEDILVKFDKARFATIVHYDYSLDHIAGWGRLSSEELGDVDERGRWSERRRGQSFCCCWIYVYFFMFISCS